MDNYIELGIRYLKMNKRRTMATAAGVAFVSMVLYIMLAMSFAYVYAQRADARSYLDAEVAIYTSTKEETEAVLSDYRIRSASIASTVSEDTAKNYETVIYANVTNPYRMRTILEDICEEYGVTGELNQSVAWTYLQDDGAGGVLLILFVVTVTYMFAVIGIGIIRTSIQLMTIEQIRDYGNLRCIGATKTELRRVITVESVCLEAIGMAAGCIVGEIVYLILSGICFDTRQVTFWPLVMVIVAFLFDLFFMIRENAKLVTSITPVEAVRGKYKLKEKRVRSSAGMRVPFLSIETEYAMKNVWRNPFRFMKTVGILAIGVAAVMLMTLAIPMVSNMIRGELGQNGYYQMYIAGDNSPLTKRSAMLSELPSADWIDQIQDFNVTESVKYLYSTTLVTAGSRTEKYDLMTDEAKKGIYADTYMLTMRSAYGDEGLEYLDTDESISFYSYGKEVGYPLYGYDEADYARFEKTLTDGTTDLSDDGILIVNGGEEVEQNDLNLYTISDIDYTTLKVGDTLSFIDFETFYERSEEAADEVKEEMNQRYSHASTDETVPETITAEWIKYHTTFTDDDGNEIKYARIQYEYMETVLARMEHIRQEMIEAGEYKTYTIEGICDSDPNLGNCYGETLVKVILPMDRFRELTGYDEDDYNGFMIHFNTLRTAFLSESTLEVFGDYVSQLTFVSEYVDPYSAYNIGENGNSNTYFLGNVKDLMKAAVGIAICAVSVLVILTAGCINIINTGISNLHIRRREFAELRAIGFSVRELKVVVITEVLLAVVAAFAIGIAVGFAVECCLLYEVGNIVGLNMWVLSSWLVIIGFTVLMLVILAGAEVKELVRMCGSLQEDLILSGE